MKKLSRGILLLLIFIFFSVQFSNSQSGWFPVNSGDTINTYQIQFVNSNTGWNCGYQFNTLTGTYLTLNKSTDGGLNWFSQLGNINSGGTRFLSLFFLDANTGYAGGVNGILKTTNGGNNYYSVTPIFAGDMFFINSMTGWLCGVDVNNHVAQTINGGLNWVSQNNSVSIMSVYFADSQTGWAVGDVILHTTNSGTQWIQQAAPVSLVSVFANSAANVWAAGNTILHSTNGGTNWSQQTLPIPGNLSSIYFTNPDTGYAIGGETILKTTNGGSNWYIQQSINGASLNCVNFVDQNTGFVCGVHGLIYKTTNGGGPIGIKQVSTEIPKQFYLFQNYPNPFNPTTVIRFQVAIPVGRQASYRLVEIKIFDILGKEITTLVNEKLQPGSYEVSFDASGSASGIYFYKLLAGDYTETKKMMLLK